jgi:hypothetical protein
VHYLTEDLYIFFSYGLKALPEILFGINTKLNITGYIH